MPNPQSKQICGYPTTTRTSKIVNGGAPSLSSFLNLLRLKISIGGTKDPAAFMQHTPGVFEPLSLLIIPPT